MIQDQLDPASQLIRDATALCLKSISALVGDQFSQFPRVAEALIDEASRVLEGQADKTFADLAKMITVE